MFTSLWANLYYILFAAVFKMLFVPIQRSSPLNKVYLLLPLAHHVIPIQQIHPFLRAPVLCFGLPKFQLSFFYPVIIAQCLIWRLASGEVPGSNPGKGEHLINLWQKGNLINLNLNVVIVWVYILTRLVKFVLCSSLHVVLRSSLHFPLYNKPHAQSLKLITTILVF